MIGDEPVVYHGDEPVAGFYRVQLTHAGVFVPVRIWHGLPVIDGEEQDRAPQWCVEIDGHTTRVEIDKASGYICTVPLDVMRVWPKCGRWPIPEKEYLFMLRRRAWAREFVPQHPVANPRQPIDVRKLPPAF